jgi:hypothetical protein
MTMSATPRAVKRQVEEANRLLASLAAKPGETPPAPAGDAPPVPAGDAPPPATDNMAPAAAPTTTISDAPPPPPPVVEPTPDFQQKYAVLKGKYDKEIPELKATVSELVEKNRQLEHMLAQMAERSAPPVAPSTAKLVKPEEITEYGEEFFDVVGRRAREILEAELAPLRSQVQQANAHKGRVSDEERKQTIAEALTEQVPGWEAINTSQQFLAWLADRDVFSGKVKRELLTEAFQNGDAARVVQFFKAFQEDPASAPAPAARTPSVDAGTLVAPGTPRSGSPAEAPGGGRMWTQAEVSQFYADARRGRIPAERKAQIEKEIIRAAAEGRVT